jgi:LacI family transcriptional regulator
VTSLTLDDIAKKAGVSRSTVSRVINGDPNVSERTRTKVQEIIHSINFQPNLAARSLAAGRTQVIGLVIPNRVATIFSDPFFSLIIQGVSLACNSLNYSVMLWLAEPEYERKMINQILYSGLIDGIIVASMLIDDPLIDQLFDSKRPFITIGRRANEESVSYIDADNRTGAHQGVSYILHTGRRRVAAINGPQNMIAGFDRFQGYKDALRERGLPLVPELVEEGDFSETSGYLAMKRLLSRNPDSVFAASDNMAFGCMRAIQEVGLCIPKDIAVVGFDNIPKASSSEPPLTTVQQPIQRTGSMAAELLIDLIEHPEIQASRIVLPTELVIRASC